MQEDCQHVCQYVTEDVQSKKERLAGNADAGVDAEETQCALLFAESYLVRNQLILF